MGARRSPCGADGSDDLAGVDLAAHRREELVAVSIARLESVAVIDDDEVSIAASLSGEDDLSGLGRADCGTGGRGDVYAVVGAVFSGDGIDAIPEV